jgi:cytochrome c553
MKRAGMLRLVLVLGLGTAGAGGAAEPVAPPVTAAAAEKAAPAHPLRWDAMEKSITPEGDASTADFEFRVTNTSSAPLEIVKIQPSCGCTVAELPSTPWILAPGAKGAFHALVDFAGKHGKFSKTLHVNSAAGTQMLTVTVILPDVPNPRDLNRQMATKDRQAVFRGDCASCHATPLAGKTGDALFHAACGICHDASPRAAMVPNLYQAREPRDAAFWNRWIREGKDGTLMPAFARERGGPLTDEQIESLVAFALNRLPTKP